MRRSLARLAATLVTWVAVASCERASQPASERPGERTATAEVAPAGGVTPATAAPSPESTTAEGPSIEATVDGASIAIAQAIAMPLEDGTALVVLGTDRDGCTVVQRKDTASTVFGVFVQWKVGATTDVARMPGTARPYAIAYDGTTSATGRPGRKDLPWNAKGTVTRIAEGRLRIELDGECCKMRGEIDVLDCGGA